MRVTIEKIDTTGQIALAFGCDRHQVTNYVRLRGLKPVSMRGRVRLFDVAEFAKSIEGDPHIWADAFDRAQEIRRESERQERRRRRGGIRMPYMTSIPDDDLQGTYRLLLRSDAGPLTQWFHEHRVRELQRRFRAKHPGQPEYDLGDDLRAELADCVNAADVLDADTTPLEPVRPVLPVFDWSDSQLADALGAIVKVHETFRQRPREDRLVRFLAHVHYTINTVAANRLRRRR